jgi:hypothetical protein
MSRAKGQAQATREEFTRHVAMQMPETAEYDVARARVRLPETV